MKNLMVLMMITLFAGLTMAEVDPQLNTKYVYAYSGLKLRSQPNLEGQILKVIPYGHKVTILETVEKTDRIEWMTGQWVKVSHDNMEGYLFEGFISELPIPEYKFEMTQNDLDLSYPLIAWAEYHFDEVHKTDTIQNEHLDKITQHLENGITLTRRDNPYDFRVELDLPDTKIGDAYNLLKSMLLTQPERLTLENNSVFIDNVEGDIHRIKINLENPVELRLLSNGHTKITVSSFHQGCDIF